MVLSPVRLVVVRESCFGVPPARRPGATPETQVLPFAEVKGWIATGALARQLLRYREATLVTHRIDHVSKPFPTALLLRLLARGRCTFEDDTGAVLEVGPVTLARQLVAFGSTLARIPLLLAATGCALRRLARARGPKRPLDRGGRPAYVRSDLIYGLTAGGSVGHIAGVLNSLDRFTGPPVFLTTDAIPTVRSEIETHVIAPGADFCGYEMLPAFHFGRVMGREAAARVAGRQVSFVYQRYSVGSLAGLETARRLDAPFVLEYNGSEVWISRTWGRPLPHARLARRIEDALVCAADLVVVVSRPLANELVARGVREERILVNPNGVDTDRYSPTVDGSPVRRRHGLEGKQVVGFIGTFGLWHGAEVLAEAFGLLIERHPRWRDSARLLMVGDGPTLTHVVSALERHAARDLAVLTGLVPQADGPAHLAACDILVAPHVPNRDGSPFFGSPTKLFEYMAMGKGIVASELDQLGEVLRHSDTALLVRPADPAVLAEAIRRLLEDPSLAERLGRAARAVAVARHSWHEHTRRIVEALERRLDQSGAA